MPVPAVVDVAVLRPGDDVRDAGRDLLVAAGAAVVLGRAAAPDLPYDPLLAAPLLGPFEPVTVAARAVDGLRTALLTVSTRGHGHTS